jgi:hypothetical protein
MDKERTCPPKQLGFWFPIYLILLFLWEIDFLYGLGNFLFGGLHLLNSRAFTREAKHRFSGETLRRIGQYINRGNKHFARCEYSEAVETWTAVKRFLSPWSSVCVSNNLACAYSRLGEHSRAYEYIQGAETMIDSRPKLGTARHFIESNRRQIEQFSD